MVQPKYQFGERVWFMKDNKPVQAEIKHIFTDVITKATVSSDIISKTVYRYSFIDYITREHSIYEGEIFKTKEDLIKSL